MVQWVNESMDVLGQRGYNNRWRTWPQRHCSFLFPSSVNSIGRNRMRRPVIVGALSLFLALSFPCWAQQDPLEGKWDGNMLAPGNQKIPVTAVFKKEGNKYTGSIT